MRVAALVSATCWASAVSAAFDLNRGGAVLKAPEGDSFSTVTGTFTVPNLSGPNRLSIWVGIGDALEQDNVLGGGIVYNSTLKSFAAYFPGPTTDTTSTVPVANGNSITVTVAVSDAGGTVTIENKTQNRRTTQMMAGPTGVDPSALTALAADWFVQAYQVIPGQLVATPNFGTISFTAVRATSKNGVNVPISGAGRYEIQGTSGQHVRQVDKMRFKASIQNITTFTKLTASLNSLGPLAWVKLSEEQDSIFETISVQSAANNVINLEVPLTSLNRALRSALNATSAHIRLTKKHNLPMLALTIVTTTSSNTYSAFPTATANNDHGFDAAFDNDFGGGNRETIVTQEIPVRVLAPDTVAHLHEPACREPDVHIMLPPLMQLKSISDRFTKLALADNKSSSATTTARTRLEVAANMHGCLKMSIRSDAMSISSVWTDLNNPELDPGHVAGGEDGIAEHPSTRMKQLGSADGRSDEGWAMVRIDGRDWGKVMSVGRLGGRVIACFCHEHALILYVYLPNDNGEDESVLTLWYRKRKGGPGHSSRPIPSHPVLGPFTIGTQKRE
ncbi:cell cycle checkpoint protein [Stemphylium lycopersici]|uniref:Cell cycle checkpoint protein (Hus1) n=1 Tax=Stemphylium lycopersici TaxID=183478 RepID=A0A364N7G8_STELY|nr:cell cycle checkpoint protein [Stemphylium lycopersici]RAR13210.1 cell cycle checkpoint protein (Hus1) [Stemphylium lycopersici]